MSQYLTAVQTTKNELMSNDLPGDTKIIYLIIDPDNNTKFVGGEIIKNTTNTTVNAHGVEEQNTEKKKSKRRAPSEKVSDLEKNDDVKKRRKTKELLIYQRCCAQTAKSRCKYAHSIADFDTKVILENLKQKNGKQLSCKRHINNPLKDEYVNDSIQSILSPESMESSSNEKKDEKKDKKKSITELVGKLVSKLGDNTLSNLDAEKTGNNTIMPTYIPLDATIPIEVVYDNGEKKEWPEIVDDLLKAMKDGVFVIGKDEDGDATLPHINSDSDQHFHLVAWNYNRKCGIIYVIETSTFWYSCLSEENGDHQKITDESQIETLKKYVNTEVLVL